MNFDDKGNDYFLHNFKDESGNGASAPSETSSTGSTPTGSTGTTDAPAGHERPASTGFTFPEADARTSAPHMVEKKRKRRHGWRWFFLIVFLALGVTVYIRYFVPYATESRTTGYVTRVEKRGIIFKTFEGEMISQSQLTDTTRVYSRDFYFSIPDDSLARVIQSYEGTGRPVTLTCKRYFGTLPWRGASKIVVTSIDN